MKTNTLQSLSDSVWAFSALMAIIEAGALPLLESGASLPVLADKTDMPPQILTAALKLLASVGLVLQSGETFTVTGDLANIMTQGGVSRVTGQMQSTFGQICALIDSSRRHQLKAGWCHTDEDTLQAQGKYSEIVATHLVPLFPKMRALLQQADARFLDVGAGVGRIALKICELYSDVKAVALEPADQPFRLAQANIANSPCQSQMELRKIGVQDLQDAAVFDVIWVAQGFIPDEFFLPGLAAMKRALKPGGMILTVEFSGQEEAQKNVSDYAKEFVSSLYGAVRTPTKLVQLLEEAGFGDVQTKKYDIYTVITAVNDF